MGTLPAEQSQSVSSFQREYKSKALTAAGWQVVPRRVSYHFRVLAPIIALGRWLKQLTTNLGRHNVLIPEPVSITYRLDKLIE